MDNQDNPIPQPTSPQPPAWRPRRGGLQSTFLAAAAAVAMIIAGLAVASAQTGTSTTTSPAQTPTTSEAQTLPDGPTLPDRQGRPDGPTLGDEQSRPDGEERRQGGPGHRGAKLAAAAQAIGISEEELLTALRSGQSVAQVAQSRDVDLQEVVDALAADVKARLAEKVASGDITQAQADERASTLQTRINEVVNRTGLPERGGRGPGPRHGPDGRAPSEGASA